MIKFRISHTVALLGAGFLALIVIVGATLWLARKAQQNTDDVATIRKLRVSAVELRNGLLAAESAQRGFLFSGNEIYLAPFEGANTEARKQAANLESDLASDPQMQPITAQLGSLVDAKIAEMTRTVELKRGGQDADALDLFLTNRGKALMDQVNVFVVGIIDRTDQSLLTAVQDQERNARLLTRVSLVGAIVIILVVAGTVVAFVRATRAIAGARDDVRALNETLERRVDERTSALKVALDRAELLLSEVNHRVANSLAMVASMVRLQNRSSNDPSIRHALGETEARIQAVAAVHKRLYASGDVGLVALDEYLSGLLQGLSASMRAEGKGAALSWRLEKAELGTDASVNVGVVVTELVTNAYKYAYPNGLGEIRVVMQRQPDRSIEISVEDDGIGRGDGEVRGTGLGSRIVTSMAATLGAKVRYANVNPGTRASLSLPPTVH